MKEKEIKEVNNRNEYLQAELVKKEEDIKEILKVQDGLGRSLHKSKGGFVMSGKDFDEIDGKEYDHFVEEFKTKMSKIAKEKNKTLGGISGLNFITSGFVNSTNYLVWVGDMSKGKLERIKNLIHNVMRKELKGVFKWTDLDGSRKIDVSLTER